MVVDVIADGGNELFEVLENAAPDLVCSEVTEKALDHVQPRRRSRREAHMASFVLVAPALDARMFVGRVIVADQIELLVCGDGLVNHAQEPEPLLVSMPLLA